jgi:hypothetical protein
MPAGMRIQSEPHNKKVFVLAPDNAGAMSVQIVPGVDSSTTNFTAETLRPVAVSQFTGGKVVDEGFVNADGKMGPSFDINWRSGTGSTLSRVGFLPMPGGRIEFVFTASPDNFKGNLFFFQKFLLSFRVSGKDGEMKVQRIVPPE